MRLPVLSRAQSSAADIGSAGFHPVEGEARQTTRHIFVVLARRAFSFPVALASLLVLLAVVTVSTRFNDPDMWWHLRVGEIIWTTHTVPTADMLSFTTHHHAWIPHEWLAQLVIFNAWHFAGNQGLMLLLSLMTATLLLAGYALCTLYSGNAKVSLLGALVIWFFATTGFAIRPQMIGYILLIIELLVLELGRRRSPRWLLCLPIIFAVWVNCHGSFFLGMIVAGLYLFCSYFDFIRGSIVASRWEKKSNRMLAVALVLSAAALFINPSGAKLVYYPIDTMFAQPVNLSSIQEWMPLQLNNPRGVGLMVVLGTIFLLPIVRWQQILWQELLLAALGTWLAVSHERMLFVFGILVAPALTRMLAQTWDGYDARKDLRWMNAALIAFALSISWRAFPDQASLMLQTQEKSPMKAVEFLKAHPISGNMLNDYAYGGYLIWALRDTPVFIDGRGDIFEWTGVLAEYTQWSALQGDPSLLLEKYKIQVCLLNRNAQMAHVLPLMPSWKTAYADENSVILERTTPDQSPKR